MSPSQTKTAGASLTRPPFYALYIGIFLFSFHYALSLYINSSFLSIFLGDTFTGFIYAVSALATLVALAQFPRVLKALGNRRTVLLLVVLEVLALLALAYAKGIVIILPAFIASQVLIVLISFNFDVFFEAFSEDRSTGKVRGVMLTIANTAILLGPITAGFILTDGDYYKVYLASALFLLPVLLILAMRLKKFHDPHYEKIPYFSTLKKILFAHHPKDDLRHAVLASLLMNFFFSWMVVYTPIYLNAYLGFSWEEIGIIFTVMLLPFVLFEAFVGKIVDALSNETSVLATGFFIAMFFTALLSFVTSHSLLLWALLLFGTRVGMSFVEIASESYFFKHIDGEDTHILSVFRNARSFAYLAGPASAAILLFVIPLKYLFVVLALVMLCGIWNARIMKKIPLHK